jgi:hypothetical protein
MLFRRAGTEAKLSINVGDDAGRIRGRMKLWRPDDQDVLAGWTSVLNGLYHEALLAYEYGYDFRDTLTAHGTIDAIDNSGMRNKLQVEVRSQSYRSCYKSLIVSGHSLHDICHPC